MGLTWAKPCLKPCFNSIFNAPAPFIVCKELLKSGYKNSKKWVENY